MSQALRTMDPTTQKAAIQRRLKERKGGHGYFAAVDAQAHIDATNRARKAAEKAFQTPSDAVVKVAPDGINGLNPGTALLQSLDAVGRGSAYIEALNQIPPDSSAAQFIDDHVVGGA
jgi:hypothetical protein